MKISACILTKNEEEKIEKCLRNIASYVDEIVIVDDYSEDKTVEIAKKYSKTKIFEKELTRFDEQRNYGAMKASGEWIFALDPDEDIPEELLKKLRDLTNTDKYDAYSFLIKIIGMTGAEKKWQNYPRFDIRLYRKSKAMYRGYVHEFVRVRGRVKFVPLTIVNRSVGSARSSDRIRKYRRLAKKEKEDASTTNRLEIRDLIYPIRYFANVYFGLRLYKKGISGLLLSVIYTYRYCVWGLKRTYLKWAEW